MNPAGWVIFLPFFSKKKFVTAQSNRPSRLTAQFEIAVTGMCVFLPEKPLSYSSVHKHMINTAPSCYYTYVFFCISSSSSCKRSLNTLKDSNEASQQENTQPGEFTAAAVDCVRISAAMTTS